MKPLNEILSEALVDEAVVNWYVIKSWTFENSIQLYNVILSSEAMDFENAKGKIRELYRNNSGGIEKLLWADERGFTVLMDTRAGTVVENYFILNENQIREYRWLDSKKTLQRITGSNRIK